MATKRTLDSFFAPKTKKPRTAELADSVEGSPAQERDLPPSTHSTYPFPLPQLPAAISAALESAPAAKGKAINDQPDLDLLYFQPFIPRDGHKELFNFLRRSLFFYRVEYKIQRGPTQTQIRTPRYTTVFGVDETSRFFDSGDLVDSATEKPIPADRYRTCKPRPIPQCLDRLRKSVEKATDLTFNFCLVNYYATGADSISYHSDDERFLGPDPAIASLSLGARRDFLMKHKPTPPPPASANNNSPPNPPSGASTAKPIDNSPSGPVSSPAPPPLKLPLASGDMVLMRGRTQANWLHSIPKRKDGGGGRINITFRKAMVRGGTENYYCYNVGTGPVFKWDESVAEMRLWQAQA